MRRRFAQLAVRDWRGALPIGGGLPPAEAAHFALSSFSSFSELLAKAGDDALDEARRSLTACFSRHQHGRCRPDGGLRPHCHGRAAVSTRYTLRQRSCRPPEDARRALEALLDGPATMTPIETAKRSTRRGCRALCNVSDANSARKRFLLHFASASQIAAVTGLEAMPALRRFELFLAGFDFGIFGNFSIGYAFDL
jgi:hypothetical protein